MKILLSAWACEPNRGSDPGLGWNWATTLAQMGHEVWVITRDEHRAAIEQRISTEPIPNLHFVYHKFSSPPYASWIFKNPVLLVLWKLEQERRKIFWQWGAYKLAQSLTQQVVFDSVHHVTNSGIRSPSFMGFLGISFIFGPVAGGVKTPMPLRKGYEFMGWFQDLGRDIVNYLINFNPLMHLTFALASKIYCDSQQTADLIPGIYRAKSQVLFAVPPPEITGNIELIGQKSAVVGDLKVLFAGRMLYWKGLHIALKAFAKLHQNMPNSRFTVIGGTATPPKWLAEIAKEEGISNSVDWLAKMKQQELSTAYLQHDVFLFPSLHDQIGMVVIESLSHGLPVVCLDLGGPGVMVDQTCGRVIKTDGLDEEAVIQALSDALIEIAENPELRKQLSEGALARPTKFAFKDAVDRIYPVESNSCQ